MGCHFPCYFTYVGMYVRTFLALFTCVNTFCKCLFTWVKTLTDTYFRWVIIFLAFLHRYVKHFLARFSFVALVCVSQSHICEGYAHIM
jgi:hypothetical protein